MRSLSPEPRRETLVQIYCFWVSAPESTSAHQGESGISEGLREGGRKPSTPECSEFPLLTLVRSDHSSCEGLERGVQGSGSWPQFCHHPSAYLWASLFPSFSSFHPILAVMTSPLSRHGCHLPHARGCARGWDVVPCLLGAQGQAEVEGPRPK